ncbi:MAG: prepilin peptidase [Lachnospiraceae bacterium]|nr:prepilin peptidase [Lachnospiraceae bacterium]
MKMIIVVLLLLVLAVCDLRYQKIPCKLLAIYGITLLILSGLFYLESFGLKGLLKMAIGMLPGLILLVLACLFKQEIGKGDGLVLLFLGATIGGKACMLVMFAGLFMASIVGIFLMICKKGSRKTRLPYIPFVLLGYILTSSLKVV